MPLKLTKRPGSDAWYIRGTVAGARIFETTGTENRALAEQARAKREAGLYEERILGRRPAIAFLTAAQAYLDFEDRGVFTENAVKRLTDHFNTTDIAGIRQAQADAAVAAILKPDAAPATKVRIVYTPLTAILNFSADREWCEPRRFKKPKNPKGKTRWITPAEATQLIGAAAKHLCPLLRFILCTGARLSEALELQWADVDLTAATAILRDTKNGRDRIAALPPAAIVALANIPFTDKKKTRDGSVFLTDEGKPYTDRERLEGGQIKTAFAGAAKRAKIAGLTPHGLRHTWATWFYGLSKDLLLLKDEGGWQELRMVERYAHLMPADLVAEISTVWGASHPRIGVLPKAATGRMPGKKREAI